MPPKKTKAKARKTDDTPPPKNGVKEVSDITSKEILNEQKIDSRAKRVGKEEETKPATSTSKKRKQPAEPHDGAAKAKRRSSRGAQKPEPSRVLNFLFSPEAVDLCRPQDEIKDLASRGSKIKTYSTSELTPFEELVSAVILSRPISHALGVRSIRTIFNDPYNFTTPKALQEAGFDRRLQALWDARTQHKDKTATQLGQVADTVAEKFSKGNAKDTSLEGVREAAQKDMDEESDFLTSNIKGIGKTGMSIFFRRIQWLWAECYPYIDERTEQALIELGLPPEPEEVKKLVEENWNSISKGIAEGRDLETRKRRAFVIALERATGAGLESNVSLVLEMASRV